MNPSFFGPPGAQLLGLHHAPHTASRGHGVVLCSPAPHETARTHWAFRKLADLLMKAGFDVLRFDYRGTGDSAGELADTTPSQWAEDIERAVRELKDVSGARKLSAVGFRMGALCLAQAAGQGLSLDSLVMWEPVVRVDDWLDELRLIARQLRRETLLVPQPTQPGELLGFVLPPALERVWRALDLTKLPAWQAQTAVVAAVNSPSLTRLLRALEQRAQPATLHLVTSAAEGAQNGALLGNEALEKIVTLLSERR